MRARRTQTNEAARSAIILPVLALLGQRPFALLEVGASAGLCLHPDRWRVDYGPAGETGPHDAPRIRCDSVSSRISTPLPLPAEPLQIVWRAGIDLSPLDVTADDDVRWLECLIWPEHEARFERLHEAIEIARRDPARLVRGDLLTELEPLARAAPGDATLVVFHSATLAYLSGTERARFLDAIDGLNQAHWISNEGPAVFPQLATGTPMIAPDGAPSAITAEMLADAGPWSGTYGSAFLTMLDGHAVAWSDPHGASIEWIG